MVTPINAKLNYCTVKEETPGFATVATEVDIHEEVAVTVNDADHGPLVLTAINDPKIVSWPIKDT